MIKVLPPSIFKGLDLLPLNLFSRKIPGLVLIDIDWAMLTTCIVYHNMMKKILISISGLIYKMRRLEDIKYIKLA